MARGSVEHRIKRLSKGFRSFVEDPISPNGIGIPAVEASNEPVLVSTESGM
jgi:hypothetical protein